MRKVLFLTDSACDIPKDLEEKYNICILNFSITVDGESYEERKDFSFEEYYEILKNCVEVPKTAQITSIRFAEKYAQLAEEGYTDIIHVSICKSGSATFDASILGEKQYREDMPDSTMKIHRINSRTYSMVYGYFIIEAAKKLENGAEICDICDFLKDRFARAQAVLSAYNLKFIKKSGRVSAAAAFAGELLGLKPIISLIDGKSKVEAKVRGEALMMPTMIKQAKQHMCEDFNFYMVACTDDEKGKAFAKLCKKEFGYAPATIFKLGAAITTNTGPEAIALVYLGENRGEID